MAEPSKPTAVAAPPDREKPDAAESTAPAGGTWLSRFFTKGVLGFFLVVSLLGQAAGIVYCRASARRPAEALPEEIGLGAYCFQASNAMAERVAAADFALHVTLQPSVEQTARRRLADRKCRVRQAIEELLRKAHCADFDDPSLGDVKRQVQEQVNQVLGIRAVADVILTDLKLQHAPREAGPARETAGPTPQTAKAPG